MQRGAMDVSVRTPDGKNYALEGPIALSVTEQISATKNFRTKTA